MHRLPSIILTLLFTINLGAQSPHGEHFQVDCGDCHNPNGWTIDIDTFQYDHNQWSFQLEGMHLVTDCKECHISMIFNEAPSQCNACHDDVHNMSVGNDCVRCHTAANWLVDDIPELHEANGFPLIGNHNSLSCVDCHTSDSNLWFDRLGNECTSCHMDEYLNTTSPNHQEVGYSPENCMDCHDLFSAGWGAGFINHNFFPLTMGHDIQDCAECHLTDKFSDTSPECVSCHLDDFNNTTQPDHEAGFFPIDCNLCHTTEPGWSPAGFPDHDPIFPIYSGNHQGEWNSCADCHINPNNFNIFSCIDCHEHNNQAELANEHEDENDFVYESSACYACHPTGEADD